MLKVCGIEESKAPRQPMPPWGMSHLIPYEYRRTGTRGCEILNQDGDVVAWAVDEMWAVIIVAALLNEEKSQ